MSDTVKKVAIPTLGGMAIAGWIVGADPIVLDVVFGLFVAATGLPLLGMVFNGLKSMFKP